MSSTTTYKVRFSGDIVDGLDRDTVKAALRRLTGLPSEKIEVLFSGKRIVIKQTDDREVAERFSGAFAKAGAICSIAEEKSDKSTAVSGADATPPRPGSAATALPHEHLEKTISPEQEATKKGSLSEGLIGLILFAGMLYLGNWALDYWNAKSVKDVYYLSKQSGEKGEACFNAGVVAVVYAQANNEAKYKKWKKIEKADCSRD